MQYAVVKTGGKQYKVLEGSIIDVDRLPQESSSAILLDKVLMHVADGTILVGTPYIDSVLVKAKILEHLKGDKIRVAKYKAKARYRRVTGFRAHLTRIQIEKIEAKTAKKSQKKTESSEKETKPKTRKTPAK